MFRYSPFVLISTVFVLLVTIFTFSVRASEPVSSMANNIMVVDIHADWCPACKNIEPTLIQIRKDYKGRVQFATLDVTNKKTAQQAEIQAKQLGLDTWFAKHKTSTALVGIFKQGKEIQLLINEPDSQKYRQILDPLLVEK